MNTNDNRLKAHKLIDHIFQDLLPAHGMAQRPEQIQLSHRMLDAMQDGRIALCDAGTGIGKTCHGSVCFPDRADRPPHHHFHFQYRAAKRGADGVSAAAVLRPNGGRDSYQATESGHPQRQKPLCLRRAAGQAAAYILQRKIRKR